MTSQTQSTSDDKRVKQIKPLIPPEILLEDIPVSNAIIDLVNHTREEVSNIVKQKDDRLICIVGPCSVHDPKAAIEYANLLKDVRDKYSNELCIIMRVYFEKPRTVVGWKGLINDPCLDNSFSINKGLKIGRKLLMDINAMGMPVAVEFLVSITTKPYLFNI